MAVPYVDLALLRHSRFLRRPRQSRQGETQMHADKPGCTQMRCAEPTLAHGQPVRRASAPAASSWLIRVHLRCHFLLPEQGRDRRRGSFVILGRSDPDRVQSSGLKNLTSLCHDVTLFATGDRVLAAACICG
jgi:hypothetical protein